MKERFIPLIAALAAGLVLVAPAAASAPATTSLQIQQKATFVNSMSIEVFVVVQCPAGVEGVALNVGVSQQQTVGPNNTQRGTQLIPVCTGAKQTIAVTIGGGIFTIGEAFARATALTPTMDTTPNPVDSRVITIS